MDVEGTVVGNYVSVHIEYMTAEDGQWPAFYEWKNHAAYCYAIGDRCLTSEELYGVHVQKGMGLFARDLQAGDDGQTFSFEADVRPGAGPLRARVVAQLDHSWSSPAANWTAHNYYWSWARFDLTLPPPPTVSPGPAPTDTPLPSATPTAAPAGAPVIVIRYLTDGQVVTAPPGQPATIEVQVQVSDPDNDLQELVLTRYSNVDTHRESFTTRPHGGNYAFQVPLQPGRPGTSWPRTLLRTTWRSTRRRCLGDRRSFGWW